MNNKLLLYLSIILVIIWMIIIYGFSDTSADKSNNESKSIVRYIVSVLNKDLSDIEKEKIVKKYNKPLRKVAHASVYFVLACFVNSVVCVFKKNKLLMCNFICLIICFVYACSDEIHQMFVSNRSCEFTDIIIDTFGAFIGCLFFNVIYNYIKKKRSYYEVS